jgi:hypothetical protein
VFPDCAGVEYDSMMIMESGAANVTILLKMNPTAYGCKLQAFPTTPQFAICQSDVVFVITGINCGV